MADNPPNPGAALKELSSTQWLRLSQLLDESIDMSVEERNVWLSALDRADPAWAAFLRSMFAAETDHAKKYLETQGLLSRRLTTLGEEDFGLVGKRFGPYRVLSLLGHGGMGSVWLAERVDGLFSRQVALKLVHPALVSRVLMERSAREREILASLNHPNIARLIDAGYAEDGQPYLALEYVAGAPLSSYCDERRLSIRERLQLFRQILGAVQYAHAHLVIHRDLKPSNIVVTSEGQVYLLDFGIAKLLTEGEAKETELTRLGGRALTPEYSAPEQIAGAPITTAADVYALGVMLYELLIGERPYRLKRDTRGALEEAILQADPVAPSRAPLSEGVARARGTTRKLLCKLLESDLDTIVMKALKKSPAERYATANAFDEDIARYLSGDVVLAQRDSLPYRAGKFVHRYRVAIGALGILLLTLAGGLAATSYEARVAAEQRDAALQARTRALTQTAAARLKDSDVPGALAILLALSPQRGAGQSRSSEELNVFQEARAADFQLLVITGHTGAVHTAVYSPDGSRIVTSSADSTARIWDAATGRELLTLRGNGQDIRSARFSPDGQRIVTTSYDKTARIWDAATGRPIMVLSGYTVHVHSAVFSPDGQRIVTSSGAGSVSAWDAVSGRQLTEFIGHTDTVPKMAFSPDGGRLATASFDRSARIWDAATGRELVQLKGHTGQVWNVAFSPDGKRVVTASFDNTARIWDAATGRQLLVLSGHKNVVTAAEFSRNGQRIVTSSEDKTARVWDAGTGREMLILDGHCDLVEAAEFSPDGQRIVTACMDSTARIWDIANRGQLMVLAQHSDLVASAEFSADGKRILTASWDGTARIWEAPTGREVMVLNPHSGHIEFAAFSPDASRVVTAGLDLKLRVWEAASGREISTLIGHSERVEAAAFSPDGQRVVSASWDNTARIWDAATGAQLRVLRGHADKLDYAAFSPDGRYIVTASYDKTARVWDAATGAEISVLAGHSQRVSTAMFSPDGGRIVTASSDKTARIWDAATGEQIQSLRGHEDVVEMAAYSADGRRIVTGSYDRTARIWDALTGEQLQVFAGHADLVETAMYSRDGQSIVTGSDDATARIWDGRTSTLAAQFAWAEAALFDPLRSEERFDLGLSQASGVRRWSGRASKCDESAAAPYDPDRLAPGVMRKGIVADIALQACAKEADAGSNARSIYQNGRAQLAGANLAEARADFERAVADGYRTAQVDLGMLLLAASVAGPDIQRAITIYERAWSDGVPIAGFELGSLYEHGVRRTGNEGEYLMAPDDARAWLWYQRAAAAGEPNALARFAQKAEDGSEHAQNAAQRHSQLLNALKYYAAAAERARSEDWPDETWKNWRYRRASLARLLARDGMMAQVAEVYEGALQQYSSSTPAMWERSTQVQKE
jgi:WD40 repeat protein/tRNA A-37 threonylcarbamoyl transferase component Bud32